MSKKIAITLVFDQARHHYLLQDGVIEEVPAGIALKHGAVLWDETVEYRSFIDLAKRKYDVGPPFSFSPDKRHLAAVGRCQSKLA